MGRHHASDLRDNPQVSASSVKRPELPVNVAIKGLSIRAGDELELFTRGSMNLVKAANIAYIYAHVHSSAYAQGRIDQMERFAVSRGGLGRRELIDVVAAGGPVPDAYLNDPSDFRRQLEFTSVKEVDS